MTEIEMNEGASRGLDRRTIIKGAAWSVPVVAAAVATPFAAATTQGGLLDLNAGCIQVAGVSLFPGFSVNNVGTDPYSGTITVVETIDLSNIALDPAGLFPPRFDNAGALSSTARGTLWALLLIEGIASGSSAGVSASPWTISQQGPTIPILGGRYTPLAYSRTITINTSIAAGNRAFWGNLLDVAGLLNTLAGLGIGSELVVRSATITSPTGNPPVVDAGPSTLDWSLLGGC